MSAVSAPAAAPPAAAPAARSLPSWWPLAGLVLAGAALRLSTLDLQSLWYDEAFTPVHVLHAGLGATLRAMVHTENSPPLWYLLEWADARLLGDGTLALRIPSALAGIATIAVAWAIGAELAGRRCAVIAAALVAFNPLFVWYSQEARVYALFALMSALALLCFLRAEREPTPRRMAAFALTGALALATHYFEVFMLVPMVGWLLLQPTRRRAGAPAIAALVLVGAALIPLVLAQGGHGTQWIGRWALSSRLQAIPQYYLTGYSGAPLGHGIELLVALPIIAGVALALRRAPSSAEARAMKLVGMVVAGALVLPVALALLGADYLAPRNLLGAMVPVSALIALLMSSRGAGRAGAALAALTAAGFLIVSVDVDLSPRLQRGNWRALARALGREASPRAITTVQLGSAPLVYYLPGLHNLARGATVRVGEIDETGYAPLRPSAGRAPASGFVLIGRRDVDGLIAYRFVAPVTREVSAAELRRHVITRARPEVLVSGHVTSVRARG